MSRVAIDPGEYSILICDDEDSIRSFLGEAVAEWGFKVQTAPNGEAAVEALNSGNIPHVIMTDIRMGGISGIELAEYAKKLSDEIEVIIMTSHGTFETAVQAMRLGVHDYLSKPIDNLEDVRNVLLHVCERIYLRFYSEYLLDELKRKNQEVESLAEMTSELAKNLDLAKTIEIGCRGLSKAFANAPTVFFQYIPGQRSLMATTRSVPDLFAGSQPKMLLGPHESASPETVSDFLRVATTNEAFLALLAQASAMNPSSFKMPEGFQWRGAPLITRGVPRGIFAIAAPECNEEESASLLNRYVQNLSTAFENTLLHARVVEISIRDGLTGLFNVRHFRERFQQELHLASRLQHPLSVLFFDVDHFKKYNDTNGHPAGDQVLRMVADLMRKNFRGSDVLARYGGEEFVVLLTHTAFADALEKAEQFRRTLESAPFPNAHTQPLGKVSVSIGVAEFPGHGTSVETIIKAADDALYEAKKRSRNVVVPGLAAPGYIPPFASVSQTTKTPA